MTKWTLWGAISLAGYLLSHAAFASTITVEGTGKVEIPAEWAILSVSTRHIDDTASDAQHAVDELIADLLNSLQNLPVAEDTVAAGQLRIQPQYRWNPRQETQEFVGYEATRTLSFKLTDLSVLGEALQLLSETGADSIHSTRFGSSQTDTARSRALRKAYAAAQADAEALATAAGLKLGAPQSISTSANNQPPPRPNFAQERMSMSAEAAPRYEPGQLLISASVSVLFATHD